MSPPPGETHLIVSVRDPGTVQGIQIFDIEREQLADGSNAYATMLGGVPSNSVADDGDARDAAHDAQGLHVQRPTATT